jgi:hypothetical protein
VIFLEINFGLEFADPCGICKTQRITAKIFVVWQIRAAIFKNESKLQFPKIATKA